MCLQHTIIVGVFNHPRLWGEGFPKEWAVQVVTGPVRRPVGVIFVTAWWYGTLPYFWKRRLESILHIFHCCHSAEGFVYITYTGIRRRPEHSEATNRINKKKHIVFFKDTSSHIQRLFSLLNMYTLITSVANWIYSLSLSLSLSLSH